MIMAKFKVGDRVRLKKGIVIGERYNGIVFTESMRFTRSEEIAFLSSEGYYFLSSNSFYYSDDMLEKTELILSDLKNEMIVELRNGKLFIVLGDCFVGERYCMRKDQYSEQFRFNGDDRFWDIVAVYRKNHMYSNGLLGLLQPNSDPIWEEKQIVKILEPDRTVLKNLDEKYQWIARDKNGTVCVYGEKPFKGTATWNGECFKCLKHFPKLFQFVQWRDVEPVNFRELLKES